MKDGNKNDTNSHNLLLGMCIGLAIGTSVGLSTHNIGLWLLIGLSLGLSLGLLLDHRKKGNGEDDTDDKE